MPTNPTLNPLSEPLSEPQITALKVLIRGESVTAAARAAGVTRQTASHWKHHDPKFIAHLNAARHDLLTEYEDRIRRMSVASLDVLEERIAKGDEKAAIALLNLAGKLPKPGKTDPRAIAEDKLFEELASSYRPSGADGPEVPYPLPALQDFDFDDVDHDHGDDLPSDRRQRASERRRDHDDARAKVSDQTGP